jgi:uncharacterized membrane protein
MLPDFIHPKTLLRQIHAYTRKLWVRVMLMGLMAFVALGVTQLIEGFVPDKVATLLHGDAADRLLQIIANAMLVVTTFSITVMVTVYRASSTQWTPRVHRLILEDKTTQNTLAVFIGAYVYALVAIILRELGVYVDERAFVLFIMTVLVLAVIVIYLIRWVLHLQTFGSLIDVARQIEQVTTDCFRERLSNPCLGANALTGDIPEGAEMIPASESGYIQHVYPEALNATAKAEGARIYFSRNIGSYVAVNAPLVMVTYDTDDADREGVAKAVRACIVLGDLRTYDQDPRFGLVVMGEVASKALSPGVNDPGTAIDVIGRIGRILSLYKDEVAQDRDEVLEALYVPPLDPQDLIEDGFGALARDGVQIVEVQQRLQDVLAGLMNHPDKGLRTAAGDAAKLHLQRAQAAITFGPDRDRVRAAACAEVRAAVAER